MDAPMSEVWQPCCVRSVPVAGGVRAGKPRLNWSNPSVNHGGVPMRTADISHNHRVLVERKATVAGFR
jgi:hypothetical protein